MLVQVADSSQLDFPLFPACVLCVAQPTLARAVTAVGDNWFMPRSQFDDQSRYMRNTWRCGSFLATAFVFLNMILQVSDVALCRRRPTDYGCFKPQSVVLGRGFISSAFVTGIISLLLSLASTFPLFQSHNRATPIVLAGAGCRHHRPQESSHCRRLPLCRCCHAGVS